MMSKIAVIIPAFNEAHNIIEVLKSVDFCDEVILVDSKSTDNTVEIAQPYFDKLLQREYIHSASQKNWAIPQATHEWILLVDADERVTPELKEEITGTPVAQVGESYLFQEEITELLPPNYSQEDSTNIVKRYVDNWIERKLLLKEAESKSGIDQKELEERLEDYKYQLLVHAYKQNYVNEYLDTLVTEPQISTYYEENKANFELKQPIVKAYFVKVKLNTPQTQLDDLRKWMRSDLEPSSDETEKLKSYSYGFAASYFLQDDKWLPISELVAK